MSKAKTNGLLPIVYLVKLASFVGTISSALLCWMFAVSKSVSTGMLSGTTVTEEQREAFWVAARVTENLLAWTIAFAVVTVISAVLYFNLVKKKDNGAQNKALGVMVVTVLITLATVFHDNILSRLVINTLN